MAYVKDLDSFIPKGSYAAYKIYGGDSPLIVVMAPDAESALCYARTIDKTYCATQRLDCSNFDIYPPVTEDVVYHTCFCYCEICKMKSLHFSRGTCKEG